MKLYLSRKPIVDDDRRAEAAALRSREAVMIACGLMRNGEYYENLRQFRLAVEAAEFRAAALVAAYDADQPHDPRTPDQIALNQWQAEWVETLESVRP